MQEKASLPILSVLIVTFQSKDEISACLETIPLVLQGRPIQVIVVENASRDGIGELIRSKFSFVRYIEAPANLGFARANNLAYEEALGEYILFLNPDTISNETAYLHCLRRLQNEPEIGVISPMLQTLDGRMDLACRRSIPTVWDGFCRATGLAARFSHRKIFAGYNLTYLMEHGTYDVGSVNGAFMLCPRRVLLRTGVFDEQFFMYGDDLDFCYRIRQAGYRVVYDGSVKIIHIKGVSSSKNHARMAGKVFDGTKMFYLKHFNPNNSRLIKLKYNTFFFCWKMLSETKARYRGYKKARPL